MDMVGMMAILKEMDIVHDMIDMIKYLQWKCLMQYVRNACKCRIPKIYIYIRYVTYAASH